MLSSTSTSAQRWVIKKCFHLSVHSAHINQDQVPFYDVLALVLDWHNLNQHPRVALSPHNGTTQLPAFAHG